MATKAAKTTKRAVGTDQSETPPGKRDTWPNKTSHTLLSLWERDVAKYNAAGSGNSITKASFHRKWAGEISKTTSPRQYSQTQVENKVDYFKKQFKAAERLRASTGWGASDHATQTQLLYDKCPFYRELVPILQDRHDINPRVSFESGMSGLKFVMETGQNDYETSGVESSDNNSHDPSPQPQSPPIVLDGSEPDHSDSATRTSHRQAKKRARKQRETLKKPRIDPATIFETRNAASKAKEAKAIMQGKKYDAKRVQVAGKTRMSELEVEKARLEFEREMAEADRALEREKLQFERDRMAHLETMARTKG